MNILITGGSGFLGMALGKRLMAQGHALTVLTRHAVDTQAKLRLSITTLDSLAQITSADYFDAVINLAGEPIFASRWTPARKQLLRDSRIKLTRQLVNAIERMTVKPEVLISGSAIGVYGNGGDTLLTEQSACCQSDFSQQLCADWEAEALEAENLGVRVCRVRTGLVLAADGGLLQRMLPAFRLGLGGRLGNGKQWMSWIHREDWLAMVERMLTDRTLQGAYNATAPYPVTNSEFSHTLASTLNRPALLPVSAWLLEKMLGEMAQLVLGSQRVLPERWQANGYGFAYPSLPEALVVCLTRH